MLVNRFALCASVSATSTAKGLDFRQFDFHASPSKKNNHNPNPKYSELEISRALCGGKVRSCIGRVRVVQALLLLRGPIFKEFGGDALAISV